MLGAPVFRTALFGPWSGNALWTAARAVPSIDLPFADSKSLVDAITGRQLISYARASSGTYVDSAGVLRTAVTNLLLRSEEFDTASWSKTGFLAFGSGSIANATTAPDGTLTADLLTESTALSERTCYQSGFTTTSATLSCYIKPNGRVFAGLRFYGASNNWVRVTFTLTGSGSASAIAAGSSSDYSATSASITAAGNGWYRVSLSATRASGVSSAAIDFATSASPTLYAPLGNELYTGNGTSGIYLWGAQLEQSSTVGEYIPTGSTINSAPRFDHNPLTGESLGLLVEEQRTNSIRNNTMVGAVAGTPGTVPTNWAYLSIVTGITTEIVGTGVSSGINYIDIRLSGTAAAAGSVHLVFDASTAIAASTGQVWTSSAYFAIVSGSFSNIASAGLRCTERASGGTFVGTSESSIAGVTSNLSTNRVSATRTLGATAAFVQGALIVNINSGAVVDITLRIGLPQLEQGATASSVIPTTTAAATRNADVASITGTNFSSWYNSSASTIYSEAASSSGAAYTGNIYGFGTSFNDSITHYRQLDFQPVARVRTAGVDEYGAIGNGAIWTGTSPNKFALALATTSGRQASNGALSSGSDDSSIVFPTVSSVSIGSAFTSGYFNGHIRRLVYWGQRLPNNVLQAITQ